MTAKPPPKRETFRHGNLPEALIDAAIERLEAEGIVGVQLVEGSHGWDSHVIEYFSVGTAVIPISADHTIPAPSFVLSLNDSTAQNTRLTGF